jgi:hypothetical protein
VIRALGIDNPYVRENAVAHDVHRAALVRDPPAIGRHLRVRGNLEFEYIRITEFAFVCGRNTGGRDNSRSE